MFFQCSQHKQFLIMSSVSIILSIPCMLSGHFFEELIHTLEFFLGNRIKLPEDSVCLFLHNVCDWTANSIP